MRIVLMMVRNRQQEGQQRSLRSSCLERLSRYWWCLGVLGMVAGCSTTPPDRTAEYQERYVHPLVSPGAQFSELPATVQHTVRAVSGSSAITKVDKGAGEGGTIYRITFENSQIFPPLYVAADGSILDPNLKVAVGAPRDLFSVSSRGPVTRVSPDDLPPQVVKTIQRLAPDAEMDTITREQKGQQTAYVVTFKGRGHRTLTINSDGTQAE